MEEKVLHPLGPNGETLPETKTYKISALTFEVMAAFEGWLEDRAFAVLDRRRSKMSAADYDAAFRSLVADVVTGKYGFMSPIAATAFALEGPLSPGHKKLLELRLSAVGGQDLSPELLSEICEAQGERLLTLVAKMDAPDPNSPAPPPAGEVSESKPSSPS